MNAGFEEMYQLKNPLSQKPNLDFFAKGVDYVAIF